ncbi:MAG: aminotransferase class I/II-fold pyridoxal phosphate-dependent enzyme [Candidatus Aureabacteria bacterium]|nr:aminotransferase class I/II-fold pyridoxal phosphate-dependent enzyme [Candidatus Auribacterota bacterium]
MKIKIAKRVREMPPSGIRAFFDLVIGMDDVISLGVGEPDFDTPWHIRETGIYSLEQGFTSYTSNKGLRELRVAISEFLKSRHGLEYDPEEEILVTVGVSEALDLAVRAILERNDKFLVPQPSFVSYAPMVSLAGGDPVCIETLEKEGFRLTPEALRRSLHRSVRGVILNYPSNPTGASYRAKELEALASVIRGTDLIVLSDEIYGELTYDFEHIPLPTLPGMKERTVYLNGFSKAYAMTGWRIGYAAGPREVIAAMTKIHQYTIMCASTTGQVAACEALRRGESDVQEMKREYARRRRLVCERLNVMGLPCAKPDGAFYIFPSIASTGLDSKSFSQRLLEQKKVAVVPGTAFGRVGEGFIRISYASSYENLKEAMDRIEDFLRGLRGKSAAAARS